MVINSKLYVIARQAAVCRGNLLSSWRKAEKTVGGLIIYIHPPPFKEASPLREKRKVLSEMPQVNPENYSCLANGLPLFPVREKVH